MDVNEQSTEQLTSETVATRECMKYYKSPNEMINFQVLFYYVIFTSAFEFFSPDMVILKCGNDTYA